MMKVMAVTGLVVCVVLVSGCAGVNGGAGGTAPSQTLAADLEDGAMVAAALELRGLTGERLEAKRQRLAGIAEQLEAVASGEAGGGTLAGLLAANANDPDAALKIALGRILLRRAGLDLNGLPVVLPEEAKAAAGSVAKGLRQAVGK